jgi:hypothetical protein
MQIGEGKHVPLPLLYHGITNLWSFKGPTFYIGHFDMADAIGTAFE